jgi:putative DNA primase/helicase
MVDISDLKKKIDDAVTEYRSKQPSGDPAGEFLEELSKAGYGLPRQLESNKIIRISAPDDKAKNKSGWCWFDEIEDSSNDGFMIGVGAYGSWKDGEKVTWSSRRAEYLTKDQRLDLQLRREEMRKQRDDEEKRVHAETALECWDMYQKAEDANHLHPYLVKKQIKPMGVIKQIQDRLVIPMLENGAMASLQFIQPDGFKPYKKGGKVKGCWFQIAGSVERVYIVEGYATGASVAMATGACVYVAFNAGNIYEVASYVVKAHPESQVVIAGDDDIYGATNIGRSKAEDAAQALRIICRFPTFHNGEKLTDFNDLHCAYGLEEVAAQLNRTYEIYTRKDEAVEGLPKFDGVLQDIINYYRLNDVRSNELLSIPAALSLCSVVLARNFSTDKRNRSSLFQVVVSNSGTGKETSDRVITAILNKANLGYLIQGKGYTSGSGVFSKLLERPRHIVMPNEWGIFLEGFTGKNVDANKLQIKGELLEAATKLDGYQRPNNYSTRGLKKDMIDELNRVAKNPAITMLGSTTHEVLNIFNQKIIADGFINRHIIWWSDKPMQYARDVGINEVPESILQWIDAITLRLGQRVETADEEPQIELLAFESAAIEIYKAYDCEIVDGINGDYGKLGLGDLFVRCAEMALRLSLIIELSRNPNATTITAQSVEEGVQIMRHTSKVTLNKIRRNVAGSEFEKWKLDGLEAIRKKGAEGINFMDMKKTKPFSTLRPRDFNEVIKELLEAELIQTGQRPPNGKGQPKKYYFAID